MQRPRGKSARPLEWPTWSGRATAAQHRLHVFFAVALSLVLPFFSSGPLGAASQPGETDASDVTTAGAAKDDDGRLQGWAAIITALAAALGSLGALLKVRQKVGQSEARELVHQLVEDSEQVKAIKRLGELVDKDYLQQCMERELDRERKMQELMHQQFVTQKAFADQVKDIDNQSKERAREAKDFMYQQFVTQKGLAEQTAELDESIKKKVELHLALNADMAARTTIAVLKRLKIVPKEAVL